MSDTTKQDISDLIASLNAFFKREDVLGKGYKELEPEKKFPSELLGELGKIGIMGMSFPEEYGGSNATQEIMSHVSKHLAYGWGSLQLCWTVTTTLTGFPIKTFGTEMQKKRYLPFLTTGDIHGCYGLTEPDCGSDAAAIKMTARYDTKKKGWFLHGKKTFITNANWASVGIVFARDGDEAKKSQKKHAGITAFLLVSSMPGFQDIEGLTITPFPKRGFRGAPFCEMDFQNVFIPEECLLGEVGQGFGIAMKTLEEGRLGIAAQSIGFAERAFYEFEKYAAKREVFGERLIDMPTIASKYAWHKAAVDAAWSLIISVSRKKDAGEEYGVDAAKAKLFATETALAAVRFCAEKFGAAGYTTDEIIRDVLADADATIIYEGSSDIQKKIIARDFQKE